MREVSELYAIFKEKANTEKAQAHDCAHREDPFLYGTSNGVIVASLREARRSSA